MVISSTEIYELLIGIKFTGQFVGRKPDDGKVTRAVFEVNRYGNDDLINVLREIRGLVDPVSSMLF